MMQPASLLTPMHPLPTSNTPQLAQQQKDDALEAQLGWPLFMEGPDRLGWLLNFTTVRRGALWPHAPATRSTPRACCNASPQRRMMREHPLFPPWQKCT